MEANLLIFRMVELVSAILYLFVVYYVFSISFLCRNNRKSWRIISIGFLMVIVSRIIRFTIPLLKSDGLANILRDVVQPVILLIISLLFLWGFYNLNLVILDALRKRAKK